MLIDHKLYRSLNLIILKYNYRYENKDRLMNLYKFCSSKIIPRDYLRLCRKFFLNFFNEVKSLQRQQRQRGPVDRKRTNFDQKSAFEPLAQVC